MSCIVEALGEEMTPEARIIGALVLMFGNTERGSWGVKVPEDLLGAVQGIVIDRKDGLVCVDVSIGIPVLFRDGYGETAKWIMKNGEVIKEGKP